MAGDIEAFLKMAAERRRQAQAGQAQAGQTQANQGPAGQGQSDSGGGNSGTPNRYRGQASGSSGSGGQGSRERQRSSDSGGQRGNQESERERRPLRSSLAGEREMLDPVLLDDDIPLDPYAQANDLPDRPKSGKPNPKAKSPKKPSGADTGRLRSSVAPSAAPSAAPLATSAGGSARSGSDAHDSTRRPGRGGAISDEIVRMLQTPASIPAAIVLSEILRPRDFDRDDWD